MNFAELGRVRYIAPEFFGMSLARAALAADTLNSSHSSTALGADIAYFFAARLVSVQTSNRADYSKIVAAPAGECLGQISGHCD
jgi:hypothetical protein